MKLAALLVLAGCASHYDVVTAAWTRHAGLRGQFQAAAELDAIFKSEEWRVAHAEREAEIRTLTGAARDALIAQAKADNAGPYEVQILFTTWDPRENDLDRGKRSVWHVVLVDDSGKEIDPLDIVRDKRPTNQLRAEFPSLDDFARAYRARFPHTDSKALKLRMSSERGGLEVAWAAGGSVAPRAPSGSTGSAAGSGSASTAVGSAGSDAVP
jgi:hypothetical protein